MLFTGPSSQDTVRLPRSDGRFPRRPWFTNSGNDSIGRITPKGTAGQCLVVACLALRRLQVSCAVTSAVLRPAGRAARAGYFSALNAARELDRGHAGPGLVRVGSEAAGPAFRFVLVSVLRGQCPWLSVRSGGWEPAGTDV